MNLRKVFLGHHVHLFSFRKANDWLPSLNMPIVIIGMLICVSFARSVFLMPTKERIGLSLMALVLGAVAITRKWDVKAMLPAFRVCVPILLLVGYAWILAFLQPHTSPDVAPFSFWMVSGLGCFLIAYYVSADTRLSKQSLAVLVLLLLPGVVHLAIYTYDVVSAFASGNLMVAEYIKDTSWVGRKHLSIALTELLALSLVAVVFTSAKRNSILTLFLIAITSIALASLDTRGAYFAILMVLFLVGMMRPVRNALIAVLFRMSPRRNVAIGFVVGVCALSAVVALIAGYSRWTQMVPSIKAGVHAETVVNHRGESWWNEKYWMPTLSPTGDKETPNCEAGILAGCVDSSMYLRVAWARFGIVKWRQAPQGIGANQYPLHNLIERSLTDDGKQEIFRSSFHSGLIDLAICFGVPGLALMFWFVYQVLHPAYRIVAEEPENVLILAAFLAVALCFVRLVVDGLNEGLWYYVMMITGMLAGFSNRRHAHMRHQISGDRAPNLGT